MKSSFNSDSSTFLLVQPMIFQFQQLLCRSQFHFWNTTVVSFLSMSLEKKITLKKQTSYWWSIMTNWFITGSCKNIHSGSLNGKNSRNIQSAILTIPRGIIYTIAKPYRELWTMSVVPKATRYLATVVSAKMQKSCVVVVEKMWDQEYVFDIVGNGTPILRRIFLRELVWSFMMRIMRL